jgi:hypothetical protein
VVAFQIPVKLRKKTFLRSKRKLDIQNWQKV